MVKSRKLNNIEVKKSKALADTEAVHEDFTIIINSAEKYHKPKQNYGMMRSLRSKIENNKAIEGGKKP